MRAIAGMLMRLANTSLQTSSATAPSVNGEEVPAVTIRKESGAWTVGELAGMVPTYLMRDVINPAPPAADLPVPGRDAPSAS